MSILLQIRGTLYEHENLENHFLGSDQFAKFNALTRKQGSERMINNEAKYMLTYKFVKLQTEKTSKNPWLMYVENITPLEIEEAYTKAVKTKQKRCTMSLEEQTLISDCCPAMSIKLILKKLENHYNRINKRTL